MLEAGRSHEDPDGCHRAHWERYNERPASAWEGERAPDGQLRVDWFRKRRSRRGSNRADQGAQRPGVVGAGLKPASPRCCCHARIRAQLGHRPATSHCVFIRGPCPGPGGWRGHCFAEPRGALTPGQARNMLGSRVALSPGPQEVGGGEDQKLTVLMGRQRQMVGTWSP